MSLIEGVEFTRFFPFGMSAVLFSTEGGSIAATMGAVPPSSFPAEWEVISGRPLPGAEMDVYDEVDRLLFFRRVVHSLQLGGIP